MVQRKSRFRNLKRGDGTSQKFVSGWYFQVWKFQFCLLASKYFMSVNNCSCSHINFGQTGGDLSFEFHIHFKDIGHMASSTVNFSCFKTPPALHSVAKCFAASTQHWRLWKTKLQILQLSGAKALDRLEYRMIFTAESAFWTSGLWRRAFYVRRSLKGLHRPFERIFERKWNVIWTLFWTFFEMDKSCVPLPNLQSAKQKVLTLLAKFYCIWFCSAPTSMDRCLSKTLATWRLPPKNAITKPPVSV